MATTENGSSRLRAVSRRLVLAELAGAAPVSQADLVRRTGLSRATVASVVADLIGEGRLAGADAVARAGRGRPPRLLRLRAGQGTVAAIDFGHSHVAIAVADLSGTILSERRRPLDVDRSAAEAMDMATALYAEVLAEHASDGVDESPKVVVVGIPGPIDAETGELRSGTILPGWVGTHPVEEFGARLGRSVILENDANLGAIGEHAYGRARGRRNLLYVKVSTGIGAGLILNGQLYRGTRGTAGEVGHVQVADDGALCRCGSRGCLETLSSAETAVALLSQAHGRPISVEEALSIVRSGDPGGVRLFTDMGTAIGRVIGALAATIDPELVVVGGQVVDDPGPLLDGIAASVHRYTQPYVAAQLAVVGGQLGERAGLCGGIALGIKAARAQGLAS